MFDENAYSSTLIIQNLIRSRSQYLMVWKLKDLSGRRNQKYSIEIIGAISPIRIDLG